MTGQMAGSYTGPHGPATEEDAMYPATLQTIGAERGREMREQAAAWRHARQARGAARTRPARFSFTLIAQNARSLAGHKRLHGPAAA
jgi:hypothetical protein